MKFKFAFENKIFFIILNTLVITLLLVSSRQNSYAESIFANIANDEFITCGYDDENDFIKNLSVCLQIRDRLLKSGICRETSCLMKTPDYIKENCEKNYDAFYYLVVTSRIKIENQSKQQSSVTHSSSQIPKKSAQTDDYEKGVMAFRSEDYDTAYALLRNYEFTAIKPMLGYMYLFGLGVEQNLERAAGLYLESAKAGSTEAKQIAAILYASDPNLDGKHGEDPNYPPEISNRKNIFSQKKIIDIGYEKGIKAFENHSYKTAYQFLKNYNTDEFPEAEPMLGLITMLGYGAEQKIETGFELFLEAAKQGSDDAQVIIALTYLNGEGRLFPQDFNEASKWFLSAAESGSAYAQKKLGDMYVLGQGVKPDAGSAKNWYAKASQNGDEVARKYLDILEKYGLPSCARILTADMELHH